MNHARFAPKCVELSDLIGNATSLHDIIRFLEDNSELIEYLKKNNNFNSRDFPRWSGKFSPLHKATIEGREDILKLFTVTYDFCIDAREIYEQLSMTALHRAIYKNLPQCVRYLLEQGANPNLGGQKDGKDFQNAYALADRFEERKDIKVMLEKAIIGKMREGEFEINKKVNLSMFQAQNIEQKTGLGGNKFNGTLLLAKSFQARLIAFGGWASFSNTGNTFISLFLRMG